MKRVVIGVKNGVPYVISQPTKIEVVIRLEKRRSLRKIMRTIWYHIKKRAVG